MASSKRSVGAQAMPMPAPVWLVGTYDAEGKPNIMTAAWAGVCCSKPPSVYVSLRKATYTHGSIVARGAYTVSVPSTVQVREADFCGIASGHDVDKFARTGFTAVRSEMVDAPYVDECQAVIECRLLHTVEIGLHTQFIGEVLDIKVDPGVLGPSGHPDVEKVAPFVFVGGGYRALGEYQGKAFSIGKDL